MTLTPVPTLSRRWTAPLLLAALCLASLCSRAVFLDKPCQSPCTQRESFALVWDETYYVNAARRIIGREVPAGKSYAASPAHRDPNAEHPQLGKLLIAAGIAILGDRPLGWRIGSLVFGTLALVLLYALVCAGGGSPLLALGATALMAADNLFVVHGRIATLDIYALAMLLGAGALYFRGRNFWSGAVLALAACMKLVAFYAIFVFGIFELLLLLARRDRQNGSESSARARLAATIATSCGTYIAFLWLLDLAVPPVDGRGHVLGDPFHHIKYMLHYAREIVGNGGIASHPWQWFVNEKTLNYYSVYHTTYDHGRAVSQALTIAFRGEMNPVIIFVAIPALALSLHAAIRQGSQVDAVAAAWVLGIVLPLTLQNLAQHRTMYIYYMLLVLPGIYVSVARMFSSARFPLAGRIGYGIAVLAGLATLYPFRTLHGL
jgi:predicted membrane-bound dolichyl-phosphate-mannose-protein mannosyltransferase